MNLNSFTIVRILNLECFWYVLFIPIYVFVQLDRTPTMHDIHINLHWNECTISILLNIALWPYLGAYAFCWTCFIICTFFSIKCQINSISEERRWSWQSYFKSNCKICQGNLCMYCVTRWLVKKPTIVVLEDKVLKPLESCNEMLIVFWHLYLPVEPVPFLKMKRNNQISDWV